MKKLIALMLAVLMLCALTACSENPGTSTTTTPPPAEGFTFTYQGVALTPGAQFDATKLPQVDNFENPNCAGEGKFITYMHDAMELTVNVIGDKTVIFSIFLTDANTPTAEGLHLGDDAARISELYGAGTASDDGATITYTKGASQLVVMTDGEMVSSIEYRLA